VVILKSRLTDRLADRPKVLPDSSGGYLIIGGLQRKLKLSKMYTMYKEIHNSGGLELTPLGKTVFTKLVKSMTCAERKTMCALDNVDQEFGSGTFQSLHQLVLLMKGSIGEERAAELDKKLDELQHFLKFEFKDHLEPESSVLQHCLRHAFGGEEATTRTGRPKKPTGKCLPCEHDHHLTCEQCTERDRLLDELEKVVNEVGGAFLPQKYCCSTKNNNHLHIESLS